MTRLSMDGCREGMELVEFLTDARPQARMPSLGAGLYEIIVPRWYSSRSLFRESSRLKLNLDGLLHDLQNSGLNRVRAGIISLLFRNHVIKYRL